MAGSVPKKKPSSKISTSSGLREQMEECNKIQHNGFSKGMMMDYLLSLQEDRVEDRRFVMYTGLQGMKDMDNATKNMYLESEIYHLAPSYNTWGYTYTAGITSDMVSAIKTFLEDLE